MQHAHTGMERVLASLAPSSWRHFVSALTALAGVQLSCTVLGWGCDALLSGLEHMKPKLAPLEKICTHTRCICPGLFYTRQTSQVNKGMLQVNKGRKYNVYCTGHYYILERAL